MIILMTGCVRIVRLCFLGGGGGEGETETIFILWALVTPDAWSLIVLTTEVYFNLYYQLYQKQDPQANPTELIDSNIKQIVSPDEVPV